MDIDTDRIDDAVLALLWGLGQFRRQIAVTAF
jgi:hypothetical protein